MKFLIGTRQHESGDFSFTVEYYKLHNKTESLSSSYGISIQKKYYISGNEVESQFEMETFQAITEDEDEITEILDKLIGGFVTPCQAVEVIDIIIDKVCS